MKNIIWPVLILLIIFRFFTTRPSYKNGDRVRITSTIYSDPISYTGTQGVKIAGLKVYLPGYPEINYGDEVIVEGVVENGKLVKPKLISVSHGNVLSTLRLRLISFYLSVLPQPVSGLTAGTILGSKGALTNDFWNATKKAGVAHVVVASGTNVTFVVAFLFGFLTLFLARKRTIPFVILGIILYLFISGFEAPLIRAAIMSFLTLWAQGVGRGVSSWRILLLTALGMLVIMPDWILDIGFLLSFASTASIMLFEKRIDKWLRRVPGVLREGLSTSLAAQIGVTPILFVTFRQFNIWSPLVNALVLWTIPYIMILGTLGGVLGLLIPFIGKIILFVMYPLGWWFTTIVSIFN